MRIDAFDDIPPETQRLMDQLARHNAEARAQHLRENRARAYGEAESVCGFCATGKPKKPPLHDDS